MSESYYWHTTKKVAIEQKNNKVFITTKTFDPNGISLVQEKKLELKYRFAGNVKIVWQSNDYFILADDTQYFAVSNNEFSFEREGVVPLMPRSEIKKVIDDIFFFHSGKVQKFRYITDKKVVFAELKKLPLDFKILDKNKEGFLLRTKEKVILYNYSINNQNQITETIRDFEVDPKTAVYRKNSDQYSPDFLYDDQRFYTIENLWHINEMTEDFLLFKKQGGFLKWIYRPDGEFDEVVFEEKENEALWGYLKNGFFLNSGETIYFYAIPAKYASQDQTLIEMNNRFFRSGYNAKDYRSAHHSYMQETQDEGELRRLEEELALEYAVDVSVIKNISKLRAFKSFFTDDELVYHLVYSSNERKQFVIVQSLSSKAVYYPPVASYGNSTSGFFDDEGVIKFVSYQQEKVTHTIPHKSKLKFLRIAYLFDDKMLIENEVIDSPLDFETAALHESFVDVITGFSDKGSPNIEVAYRHYFKDKNGIYLYKTGSKKLEKM